MRIRPLRDQVILKPIAAEEVTKSGIVIPDTAEKEKPEQGQVLAVGPGKILDNGKVVPIDLKRGDKVLFSKYGPTEVKVAGKEILIVKEEDILAVIE